MRTALVRTLQITLGVFAALVALLLAAVTFLGAAEAAVDESARTLPSYERVDISDLAAKEQWTDEEYELLWKQTGLGRSALDELKGQTKRILAFQDALFYRGELEHELAAFTTPHDMVKNFEAPIVPLHDGDVLVTSTCHTFGWRNGHSALVIDGASGRTLQSLAPGYNSSYGSADWFRNAANFLVLRLKEPASRGREIADWASRHLYGVEYSLLTGFFSSPKDQGNSPKTTNCSHLVWQAYKHFGYDIDSDGGIVCTSRDIANCELFEVVQVYGFDPETLW